MFHLVGLLWCRPQAHDRKELIQEVAKTAAATAVRTAGRTAGSRSSHSLRSQVEITVRYDLLPEAEGSTQKRRDRQSESCDALRWVQRYSQSFQCIRAVLKQARGSPASPAQHLPCCT